MITKSETFKKILILGAALAGVGIVLIIASQLMMYTDKGLGKSAGWLTPVGFVIILIGGGIGGYKFYRFRQKWLEVQEAANRHLVEDGVTILLAPRSALMPDDKVFDLWRRLSITLKRDGDLPGQHVSWEVVGNRDRLAFIMRIPKDWLRGLSGELSREFPELEVNILPDQPIEKIPLGLFIDPPVMVAHENQTVLWQELTLARDAAYPLFSSANVQGQLLALMGAMSIAHPQANVGYQFLIRKALPTTAQGWLAVANKLVPKPKQGQPTPKIPQETKNIIQRIQSRAQQPIFDLTVRCWAASANEQLAANELQRITEALIAETVADGTANQFVPGENGKGHQPITHRPFPTQTKMQIAASELGEFLHLPGKKSAESFPKLTVSSAKRLPPSPSLVIRDDDLSQYRVLGHFEHATGDVDVVGQPVLDTRKHTYGVGPTGSGKSVAMVNSIISDYMNEGAGVLMIEPSGDVPAELVAGLPPDVLNDVVLLQFDDMQPPALNMCEIGLMNGGVTAGVKNAISAIQMGMGANWATSVRMQQLITNGLYVVIDVLTRPGFGGPSLIALSKFLQNDLYRETLLPYCSLQAMGAKQFWENDFANWAEQQQTEAVSVALRRLSEWIGNPEIRRTLSMPFSTLNLEHLMGSPLGDDTHQPRIVMLPLTNNDTKSLVGALFVAYFQSVIMSRRNIPKEQRRPAKLYVDEFADFVNTSGGDSVKILLAQARKFGAGVTLLTQGQGQITRDVQVELNVNTLTKFYYAITAPEEARLAVKQMAGAVDEYDVMKIPQYHAYVKIGNNPPALVRMLPPAKYGRGVPPLKRGFQCQPPAEWKALIQSTAPFSRFVKTEVEIPKQIEAKLSAPDILAWAIQQMEKGDPDNLVRQVAGLADNDFDALELTRREYDVWRAQEVAQNPALIPDALERVTWRSRWLYGIPWWLSDARFLRLVNNNRVSGSVPLKETEGVSMSFGEPDDLDGLFNGEDMPPSPHNSGTTGKNNLFANW